MHICAFSSLSNHFPREKMYWKCVNHLVCCCAHLAKNKSLNGEKINQKPILIYSNAICLVQWYSMLLSQTCGRSRDLGSNPGAYKVKFFNRFFWVWGNVERFKTVILWNYAKFTSFKITLIYEIIKICIDSLNKIGKLNGYDQIRNYNSLEMSVFTCFWVEV